MNILRTSQGTSGCLDPDFNEGDYLVANPDVALAVKQGSVESGWAHYQSFGKQEGRALKVGSQLARRNEKVLSFINSDGLGLEIGPSHNPIAPKRLGFKCEIVDHLDQSGLRDKYKEHRGLGVNIENIEAVDFVWKGEPLLELVGRTKYYDWIIASHVIEHLPDLVTFFQQCELLLKPTGVLALVIPDKRFCFDHLKASSATGELLDAFVAKRVRPSPGQVFEHFANACKKGGAAAWSAETTGEISLIHQFEQAKQLYFNAITTDSYIDTHCWRFTPESFKLVLQDLNMLGLTKLGVSNFQPTEGCEFYVSLESRVEHENTGAATAISRLARLKGRSCAEWAP